MDFKQWYSDISKKHDLSSNPDDWQHFYDYKAAYDAGIRGPNEIGHWDSRFKSDLHKDRFINQGDGTFLDTKNNTYVPSELVQETNMQRDDFIRNQIMNQMLKGLPNKIK